MRQGFTGYEKDNESGLEFAQARMYNNQHGRFTTTDPILLVKDRLHDPQQINLYVYCRNNPLVFVDPTGEIITFGGKAEEKRFKEYLEFLNKNKDKEGFADLLNTIDLLQKSTDENGEDIEYQINFDANFERANGATSGGYLSTDGKTIFVNLKSDGTGMASLNSRFAHELEHARQFDAGELTFFGNDKKQFSPSPSSYDIGDEVKAYGAQLVASTERDLTGKGGVFLKNFQNAKTDEQRADLVADKDGNYRSLRNRGFNTNQRFDSTSGYKVGQLIRPTKQNNYFFGRIRTVTERKR